MEISHIKMHWWGRISLFFKLDCRHMFKHLFCNKHEVSYKIWKDSFQPLMHVLLTYLPSSSSINICSLKCLLVRCKLSYCMRRLLFHGFSLVPFILNKIIPGSSLCFPSSSSINICSLKCLFDVTAIILFFRYWTEHDATDQLVMMDQWNKTIKNQRHFNDVPLEYSCTCTRTPI